jgi:hypothetical protein
MTAKKDNAEAADGGAEGADDAVANTAAELQRITDEAEAKGFYGTAVDETPRSHYTVEGVVAGKPTPESPDKK